MRAEEILQKHCEFLLEMEKQCVLEAMQEYAKQKCIEQRFICQTEFDKRAILTDNGCYLHSEDILNAVHPNFD
jgi:hypothetical protein